MNIWATQLPSPTSLVPLRFTNITITEDSIVTHPDPSTILQFLTACPSLEELSFTGWIHDDDHTPYILPVVSLPNLKSLHLRSTCHARAILSNLDCPKLTVLYLTHLNVDYNFHGVYTEDGDSDDEANDFSQSPFTDRATGMGLRKLLTRCNPPIRVLEMDFSDMRTKDFKVVFDKLVLLEEFLIVASDMSDKVMNLLQPFTPEGSDELQVRLPRLHSIELHNCHRLSGQVIADVLSSRIAFTDDNDSVSTLSEVAVIGCELCTAQHTQTLVENLGDRVRLE
jgi:hypothetical protein